MNKEKKNTRGITLIALVVSIIVLLILASITIAALSGDNGILTRAKEAKEKTQQAQKEEEKTISNIENVGNSTINFKNINMADTNPAGAMPTDVTILEADANKGIVIKDQNKNEWVWIEVPKTKVFTEMQIDETKELADQDYENIKNRLVTYVGVYRNGSATQTRNSWTDEWYAIDGNTVLTANTENLTEAQKKLKDGCGLNFYNYKKIYQKMLKNVYIYGGFWIGRYESGIEGSVEDLTKARTVHTNIEIETSPRAISQKDAIPYNYVYCSEAQALAKEMTPNSNYTSSLMFGIQWDLICKFLEEKTELSIADINSDSSSWGNFSNTEIIITSENAKQLISSTEIWNKIVNKKTVGSILLSVGASDKTNKMNIYDFAGNEREWTLEQANSYQDSPCAIRGSYYNVEGTNNPTSYRSSTNINVSSVSISFRTTLYKN